MPNSEDFREDCEVGVAAGEDQYQDMDCGEDDAGKKDRNYFKSVSSVASFPAFLPTQAVTPSFSSRVLGSNPDTSEGVNRLLWDSAAIYSDSRPPSNFVVYSTNGDTRSADAAEGPPLFDGNVANSTPPPLGGISAGPSGGSGTILHLACALDAPLALAFLLSMGADARSTHTAFRRLMIHEAACNGSIQCLALLLELGRFCAHSDDDLDTKMPAHRRYSEETHSRPQELQFFATGPGGETYDQNQRRPPPEIRSRGFFGMGAVAAAPILDRKSVV